MATSRPDADNTNPSPDFLHQNGDPLSAAELPTDTPDDLLEASRTHISIGDPEIGIYADDAVRSDDNPAQQQNDVEELVGGTTTSFDPEGDEGDPEETHPLLNN